MKVYTKTGDKGETGLVSGHRIAKTHPLVEAYGTVDEMNALLGLALAASPASEVAQEIYLLQNQLFEVGGDLATLREGVESDRVHTDLVRSLEEKMDALMEVLTPLRAFILPGGTSAAAFLQLARSVCRRAERETLRAAEQVRINPQTLIFLNRLSDFLFLLARRENQLQGVTEPIWAGDTGKKVSDPPPGREKETEKAPEGDD